MNYTGNRNNHKIPESANPPYPTTINHYASTPSAAQPPSQSDNIDITQSLTQLITQSVNPNVLEKIRELDNSNTFVSPLSSGGESKISNSKSLPKNANPFRIQSGLYFRDILHTSENVRSVQDPMNRSIHHKK